MLFFGKFRVQKVWRKCILATESAMSFRYKMFGGNVSFWTQKAFLAVRWNSLIALASS